MIDFAIRCIEALIHLTFFQLFWIWALFFACAQLLENYKIQVLTLGYSALGIILLLWAYSYPIGFQATSPLDAWNHLFGKLIVMCLAKIVFIMLGLLFLNNALSLIMNNYEEENYEA